MKSYIELLNDPHWLNKRNNILARDKNQCTVCHSKRRLQVHHTYYYKKQVPPWGYPDESLLTLCKKCHQDWHEHSELEYRENPTINKKHIRNKKMKKVMVKKKKKYLHGPTICLAIIQANRNNYYKDENGTYRLKHYN
jgi:5-methylcytosine-specific restriction endonuclease McrA